MSGSKKNRHAFRPSLIDAPLEEKVVMSTTAQLAAFAETQPMSTAQIRRAYTTQIKAAFQDLRHQLNAEAAQFHSILTPTQQQVADFKAATQGTINATVFRLSSQDALLPGSSRLLQRMQSALIGGGQNSLVNRIDAAISRPSVLTSNSVSVLTAALSRQLNTASLNETARLNNFFATTSLKKMSVNATGQRVSLQSFISNGIVSQLGNTLGSISQSFNNGSTTLFGDGTTSPDMTNTAAFYNQASQALNTAAFQLGSNLSLFPNASTGIIPQLQNTFFGNGQPVTLGGIGITGTGTSIGGIGNGNGTTTGAGTTISTTESGTSFTNFLSAIAGLPTDGTNFSTAASTAFGNGFQSLVTPLGNFLGTSINNIPGLPTAATMPNLFTTGVSNFGNGFNTGFGSGSIGFGTAPTNFNTNFSTGFNNAIGFTNPNFGFNVPTSAFNTPGAFNPTVTSFNPPVTAFNPTPSGFNPTVTSFNPPVTTFNPPVTSFNP